MPSLTLLEFADRMNEILPLVMKEFARRQASELYRGRVTLPQFFILEFLHKQGEAKMTHLAHFMKVTTAAMTGLIERLVRDGYCLRLDDPGDRRIIKVRLTSRGNELVGKVSRQRRQMILDTFDRISEADRRDYLRILMQIKDILNNGRKA